jgi:hypothetical protein
MFSTYCDSSGKGELPVVTVAGWVASTESWKQFEIDWRIALASFDVPYLHMREFAHSLPPFEHFKGSEGKRAVFLSTLTEIIHSTAIAVLGCLVPTQVFELVNESFYLREEFGNEFTLAALITIINGERVFGLERMQYFFEDGDEGKGSLIDILRKHEHPLPIFQRGSVPLQAADFAAYELYKDYIAGENEPEWKHRMSGKRLFSTRRVLHKYDQSDLASFCETMQVPPRSKRGPLT